MKLGLTEEFIELVSDAAMNMARSEKFKVYQCANEWSIKLCSIIRSYRTLTGRDLLVDTPKDEQGEYTGMVVIRVIDGRGHIAKIAEIDMSDEMEEI